MTTRTVGGKPVMEAPYTQEEVESMINKIRIEERYMANEVMGNFGIPAERRPKIYTEAGTIIMNMILAPAKKAPAEDPSTQ